MEEKLVEILNYIKDSETIMGGEYYVIHSDYVIALEEEIKKLSFNIYIEEEDGKKIYEILKRVDNE